MSSTRCYFRTKSICNGRLHFFTMIKLLRPFVAAQLTLRFFLRRLSNFSIIGLLLLSTHSFAIGMSELTVSSAVGERFYGLITVTGAEGLSSNDMLVSLAPRSVYRAMGVEWEYFHSQLIFDVLVDEYNQYTIRVVSSDVVFEPYLDFVVSLRSPVGSISKQLTALLEMPAAIVEPSLHSSKSQSVKTPTPEKVLPSKTLRKIQRSPVSSKPEVSTEDKILEADIDKKSALIDSEVDNSEPVNSALNVEASKAELVQAKVVPEVFGEEEAEVAKTTSNKTEVEVEVEAEVEAEAEREKDNWLHKTRSGDSLWAVARRVQTETGGKIKPIVDALYQNNSHAFIKNDIDRLKINARLSVSAAQISAVIAANKQSDKSPKADSVALLPAPSSLADELSANEDGVLSLVTTDINTDENTDNNTAAVAAETVELSERSDALASDFEKGLGASKERELSVEARMDKLYQQYEALAEKTEQLKVLEQSLNRSIADKSQLNMTLDESLSMAANDEAIVEAKEAAKVEAKEAADKRPLFFVISIAVVLLLLLVLFLKRRQAQHRASDIDNWSLDTELSFSPKPDNSPKPDDSPKPGDSPKPDDSPKPEGHVLESLSVDDESLLVNVSSQHSDSVIPLTSDELAVDADADTETNAALAVPAEGAVELEAAVYIAYERFDEAEDLLEQALEIEPDNEALQMQLLEVYAAKGKTRHFDLLSKQIGSYDNDKITIKINYLKSKL